ncbi:hypothetical protein IWX81_002068 [Salinibacterium sp. CAN_S4]|uniref:DUF6121 family protein n=1 Tax=Salinibacterium sp. CAN_S4 TaxID=2787727 RepID=UPI0018EF6AFB
MARTGLAVFATVAYLAALIALWGILSVIVDRDVIDYVDAGPLLGPSMVIAALLVTFASVRTVTIAPRPARVVVGAAVLAFVAMLLVGAVGYSITRGDFGWIPAATVHFALAPFVPGAAVLSAVVVAASKAVSGRPPDGRSESGII